VCTSISAPSPVAAGAEEEALENEDEVNAKAAEEMDAVKPEHLVSALKKGSSA
jgi:hypothetical protein